MPANVIDDISNVLRMRGKKKTRYHAYNFIKSHQHITNLFSETVNDTAVDQIILNNREYDLNIKSRTKLGFCKRNTLLRR